KMVARFATENELLDTVLLFCSGITLLFSNCCSGLVRFMFSIVPAKVSCSFRGVDPCERFSCFARISARNSLCGKSLPGNGLLTRPDSGSEHIETCSDRFAKKVGEEERIKSSFFSVM